MRGRGAMAMACALFVGACASSGVPVAREGASRPRAVASDPVAQAALEHACYGCHADGYRLAGRERLSFSYWFRGGARKKLDFSRWQDYAPKERAQRLEAIAHTVRDGEMPPWDAVLLDSRAKLSQADKDALVQIASHPAS